MCLSVFHVSVSIVGAEQCTAQGLHLAKFHGRTAEDAKALADRTASVLYNSHEM